MYKKRVSFLNLLMQLFIFLKVAVNGDYYHFITDAGEVYINDLLIGQKKEFGINYFKQYSKILIWNMLCLIQQLFEQMLVLQDIKKTVKIKRFLVQSKGDFTTKIHTLTDALGNPLKFLLTGSQRNDITQAIPLLNDISNTFVIPDKGYDLNELINFVHTKNCIPVIPFKKIEKCIENMILFYIKIEIALNAFC